jgi:hypothetical protein
MKTYTGMRLLLKENGGYLGAEETANRLQKYAERAGIKTEDETTGHNEKGR